MALIFLNIILLGTLLYVFTKDRHNLNERLGKLGARVDKHDMRLVRIEPQTPAPVHPKTGALYRSPPLTPEAELRIAMERIHVLEESNRALRDALEAKS